MASNNNTLPIPELHGDDYEYWSIKMRTLLIGKGLWDIVEEGYSDPLDWTTMGEQAKTAKKLAQKNNYFALYHLQASMGTAIFPRIASCTSAKDAWEALKQGFQGSTQIKQVRLQTLKRDFENLKMREEENVGDYCVRVKSCVDKMKTLGEEISNEVIVKKVLRTLPPKWNHVAIII